MLVDAFKVESPNVQYGADSITSTYRYESTEVERTPEGQWVVAPRATEYTFKTDTRVPKLGCGLRGRVRLQAAPSSTAQRSGGCGASAAAAAGAAAGGGWHAACAWRLTSCLRY